LSSLVLGLALGVSPGAVRDASANVSLETSLAELATRATRVVIGSALESLSVWEQQVSDGALRIVTYHRVKVERTVAGAPPSAEVWVRCLGGTVGTIGQRVEGEAVLPRGERLMLFLAARADGTASVVSMAQGAYLVRRGADGVERLKPSPERGMLLPRPARRSAAADLVDRSVEEAVRLVTSARAHHAP
jgi:hypothetical protein